MPRAIIAALLTLVVSGCGSRGFDRQMISEQLRHAPVADEEIRAALAVRPAATPPLAVGVYFRPVRSRTSSPAWRAPASAWSWRGEDKDVLLATDITSSELIASMFPIVDPTVDSDDVKGARLAAARHGADAVMIVTGAADLDAYSNPLSLLYLTIVGLWVVPGTHRDALFAAHATLLDVATGYLYASAEAEGRGTLVRPLLFIDDDEAIARARREALIALRDELVKRIRRTAR